MTDKRTARATVGGIDYDFRLLGIYDGQRVAGKLGALLLTANNGNIDPEALPDISKQMLSGLYADGVEVKDLEEHFAGEFLLFNQIVLEALKVNFPDILAKMGDGSELAASLKHQFGLAIGE